MVESKLLQVIKEKGIENPFGPFPVEKKGSKDASVYLPWVRALYSDKLLGYVQEKIGQKTFEELIDRTLVLLPPSLRQRQDLMAHLTNPDRKIHSVLHDALFEIVYELTDERLHNHIGRIAIDKKNWYFSLEKFLTLFLTNKVLWEQVVEYGNGQLTNVQIFECREKENGWVNVFKQADSRYVSFVEDYYNYYGRDSRDITDILIEGDDQLNIGVLSSVPTLFDRPKVDIKIGQVEDCRYNSIYTITWEPTIGFLPGFFEKGIFPGAKEVQKHLMTQLNVPKRLRFYRQGIFEAYAYMQKDREDLEKVNDELKRTRADLVASQQVAAVGRATAGFAHNVNNQGRVISGCVAQSRNNRKEFSSVLDFFFESTFDEDDYNSFKKLKSIVISPESEGFFISANDLLEKVDQFRDYFRQRGIEDRKTLEELASLPFSKIEYDLAFSFEDSYGKDFCDKFITYLSSLHNLELEERRIVNACNIMDRETSMLMEFAGVQLDKDPTLERQIEYDLNEGVKSVVEITKYRINERNPGIEIILETQGLPVFICGEQINHALLQIADNAVNAIGEEKGILKFETYPIVRDGKEYVACRISDTGIGISSEVLPRIFEQFFTTREEGTGLGLYIADQIVRKSRGEIKVETKLEQGSSFEVVIPVKYSRDY